MIDLKEKFTPGPWRAVFGETTRIRSKDGTLARIHHLRSTANPSYRRDPEINSANAHLIAAAPELYEALDDLLDDVKMSDGACQQAISQAKAALKKARGE